MISVISAADALQTLKSATWVATGACSVCAVALIIALLVGFKNKTKFQKVDDFQNALMPFFGVYS